MADDGALHEYRIRFRVESEPGERQVRAVADCRTQTITVELPDGGRATVDVVTARALYMLLHQAIYASLEPTGPFLRLERNTIYGWTPAGASR
ncbi:MAG: hypothetical protein ACRDJ9_06150 [Dehalococcoidia bacterium]